MAKVFAVVLACLFAPAAFAGRCTKDGAIPNPTDCSKYFQCVGTTDYAMSCPAGLNFNANTQQCDWPANVNCNAKPTAAPAPQPTSATKPAPQPTPGPGPAPQPGPPGKFKVVCYFPNWAGYRKEGGKYTPETIDPTLCTHVNYAFAVLDGPTSKIKAFDSWADIDLGFYQKTVELKKRNPSVKVLLAIGGWTDSAGTKYSQMVADAGKRKTFNEDVVVFLKKYGFDGLDIDWEYPACPQGACGASPADKQNFATWVTELRAIFDKQSPRLELSCAVSASKNVIDQAYDVPKIAAAMDHINIMAYDYHGSWESTLGQNAPFKSRAGEDPALNVEFSMKYWNQLGSPANKLVMGVPAYGKSFTLGNPSQTGFGSPGRGAGAAGPFTGEPGLLAYYEICQNLNSGWSKGTDPLAGPYSYKGDQWVGYDDPATIEKKAIFAKNAGYGGAMVWDIAMDDFSGKCCGVKNPLLNVLNNVLLGKGTPASAMTKCQ